MSKTHTPGPWMLETVPTSVGICHKIGPFPPSHESKKQRHACLYADYPSDSNPADKELLANAHLIAAAPELLEALAKIVDSAEQRAFEDWLASNSPSGCVEQVQDQWERSHEFADFCDEWKAARAAISKATGG